MIDLNDGHKILNRMKDPNKLETNVLTPYGGTVRTDSLQPNLVPSTSSDLVVAQDNVNRVARRVPFVTIIDDHNAVSQSPQLLEEHRLEIQWIHLQLILIQLLLQQVMLELQLHQIFNRQIFHHGTKEWMI